MSDKNLKLKIISAIFFSVFLFFCILFPTKQTAHATESGTTSITRYPFFNNVCSAFVVGFETISGGGVSLYPKLGNFQGDCADRSAPILFSVTQENLLNSHAGAANYDPNILSYMADYNSLATDLGRWFNMGFYGPSLDNSMGMSLDTVNYTETNITGWPLQYGHLFFGLNDLSEFDIRIRSAQVQPQLYQNLCRMIEDNNLCDYSGHRLMVGAVFNWNEPSRENTTHAFEANLNQTEGYSTLYGDPDYEICHSAVYDRCWYDPTGDNSEGREITLTNYVPTAPTIPENSNEWTHVAIPLSTLVKGFTWAFPPSSWSQAKLGGIYIGMESMGATRYWIELKNYQVTAPDTTPPVAPSGLSIN